LRIRIRIDFGWLDPDPYWQCESAPRKVKMTHKNRNSEEIHVFEVLNVLF
jgi:hypothetical protein